MFSQADILSLAILCLLLAYLHLLVLSTLFSPKTLLLSTEDIYQPKLAFKFLKYNSVVHQYNFHLLFINITQSHCIPGTLANTANDLSNFFCFPPISTVFCLRSDIHTCFQAFPPTPLKSSPSLQYCTMTISL